jgi:hypothetical protein
MMHKTLAAIAALIGSLIMMVALAGAAAAATAIEYGLMT